MPKLTLRDLFAVVTIVALALGWWLDRSRLAKERDGWRTQSEFVEAIAYKLDEDIMKLMKALDDRTQAK
jgi:hypothetical protein